jgi:hypothetical protein
VLTLVEIALEAGAAYLLIRAQVPQALALAVAWAMTRVIVAAVWERSLEERSSLAPAPAE